MQTYHNGRYKKIVDYEENSNFSNVEKMILEELVSNPRKSINEISRNISKTRKTISKKLNTLIENEKIKFTLLFNKNCLQIEFFYFQLQIKKLTDSQYFIDLLNKCPKTMLCLHVASYNMLFVMLYDERNNYLNSGNHDFFTCIHLIHRIQADPRVLKCEIHPRCDLIFPKFINIDKRLMLKKLITSPCGQNCENCENYCQNCVGCPSTIHYQGNLIF